MDKENLKHAVLNSIEADFGDNDFSSFDILMDDLMKNEDNVKILTEYLGTSARKNLEEGKTFKRY